MNLMTSRYCRTFTLRHVGAIEINSAICNPSPYFDRAKTPWGGKDEWTKDHADYVIGLLLPFLSLPIRLRRVWIQAYLAGMEAMSDGSSVVPDLADWKDVAGVGHDFLFWLHHNGLPDAYGHFWTWSEANAAYRTMWTALGHPVRGWAWWAGLEIGSYPVWAGWIG